MSLLAQIRADHITARKAHKKVQATLLGTLIGMIDTKEKTFNPARPIEDAEVIGLIRRMLNDVVLTLEVLKGRSGREEQMADSEAERVVLDSYLPKQMDEGEMETIVMTLKDGDLNLGQIMAHFKQTYTGQYDGKALSGIVKRVLS